MKITLKGKASVRILVIAAAMSFAYYAYAVFTVSDHTAIINCPVTEATTVITQQDGSAVAVVERRISVQCDYSAAGVPPPQGEGSVVEYDQAPLRHERITVGDVFSCTAKWRTTDMFVLPRIVAGADGGASMGNCKLASRT
ncbi:MAG TPA: hypothetical protein VMV62_00385 [Candidatus Paceibacterota bacterium]|nr:hypothetical protein [Candidatus Paceibacterota bacterium]